MRLSRLFYRTAPYLVLLGAWALWFWRFAAPNPADRLTYPAGDFIMQFGVFRDIAYRSLVAGRLPLWADCLDSGYPFHADPQAQLFYPVVWLIFGVLRLQGWGHFPIEALVAEVALHYLLASLFLFRFLASLSLRRWAAILGALTFTYCGYLTSYPPLQTAVLEVSIWLPLALWCAGQLAATRRLRRPARLVMVLAIAFVAGHPQTFVNTALLGLAYFAFRARQAGWRWGALVGTAAAVTVLTTALAAVQILPSLHFVLNSDRTTLSFTEASGGFAFLDILQFLITGLVSYWQPLFIGVLPLSLAVFALTRRSAEVRFWAAVAVISLVLSFGTKGAAFDAVYWLVPGLRLFHGPERLAFLVSLALSVLAAFGADQLFQPLPPSRRRALGWLILAAVCWLAFLIPALALSKYAADRGFVEQLPGRIGLAAVAAGLALAALLVRARVPALRQWLAAIFIAVAVIDLFAANRAVNLVPVFEAYSYTPLLEPIRAEGGFFRVQDDWQLPGHASCAYQFRGISGITPYHVATYARFLEQAPGDVRWQLLGVRYLVTWRQDISDSALQPVEAAATASSAGADNKAGITKVFRLAASNPQRAFLAHQAEAATLDETVYSRMAQPGFDPFATVILAQPAATTPSNALDTVEILADTPGWVQIHTISDGAGVLVLSEAYFPGWQASIDNEPAALLRADGTLMATAIPAGSHAVEFVYRPTLLLWAGLTSALALCGTLALAVTNPALERRPRS